MAFLDRFKGENKTEETKKAPKAKKPAAAAASKTEEKVEQKSAVAKTAAPKDSTAYRVLVRPIVSEKTARLEKIRQYAFVVAARSNKVEIKKAVEKHYRVHVTSVNIVNIFGKTVRSGRVLGKRSDWRKAYVTVKEGETITY
jgi:large subunit ribosomal protein L23